MRATMLKKKKYVTLFTNHICGKVSKMELNLYLTLLENGLYLSHMVKFFLHITHPWRLGSEHRDSPDTAPPEAEMVKAVAT